MFILFLLAFSLVYSVLFKQPKKSFTLKAIPAYVHKKRLPKKGTIPIPEDLPKFYY